MGKEAHVAEAAAAAVAAAVAGSSNNRDYQQRDCPRHGQNIKNTSTTKSVYAAPFASFGTTVRSGQTSVRDNRSFEANVRSGQAPVRNQTPVRDKRRFGTTEEGEPLWTSTAWTYAPHLLLDEAVDAVPERLVSRQVPRPA